jgi:hypothetical protein
MLVVHLALASVDGEFHGDGTLKVRLASYGGVRNASEALIHNIGV